MELIGSPSRCYVDLAARLTRSEFDMEKLIAEEPNAELVRRILESGHLATAEFDLYIFAVSGYSRVCEAQLIRKRMASYMIKSGRVDKHGKRAFDIVLPQNTLDVSFIDSTGRTYSTEDMLELTEMWYSAGVSMGVPEEDLRYMKQQGTEFQGLVAMNAHALMDWFKIRCCKLAQTEIKDMADKMLKLCKQDNPTLFSKAGANCVSLGYCPENKMQHPSCKFKTHNDVLEILKGC